MGGLWVAKGFLSISLSSHAGQYLGLNHHCISSRLWFLVFARPNIWNIWLFLRTRGWHVALFSCIRYCVITLFGLGLRCWIIDLGQIELLQLLEVAAYNTHTKYIL